MEIDKPVRLPHLGLVSSEAQWMVDTLGSGIYTEADSGIETAGVEVVGAAGEAHLQVVTEIQRSAQFFEAERKSADIQHTSEVTKATHSYGEALKKLKSEHTAALATIERGYDDSKKAIGERETAASTFCGQCDDLSEALTGAWHVYQGYHQEILVTSVRAANELAHSRQQLDEIDAEFANLTNESERLYVEFGTCRSLIKDFEQQQLAIKQESLMADQERDRRRQEIISRTPNQVAQQKSEPQDDWSNNDVETGSRLVQLTNEFRIIEAQIVRITLENENRHNRIFDIRQRLSQIDADRPTKVDEINRLKQVIVDLARLKDSLLGEMADAKADVVKLKDISKTAIDENGFVSAAASAWLQATLQKHKSVMAETTQLVEEQPPTSPVSVSNVNFGGDIIYSPQDPKTLSAPRPETKSVEEIAEEVKNFLNERFSARVTSLLNGANQLSDQSGQNLLSRIIRA